MRKETEGRNRLSRITTGTRKRETASEARHTARPRLGGVRSGASWLVALATGALVAYRGFTASRGPLPADEDDLTVKHVRAAQIAAERARQSSGRNKDRQASGPRSGTEATYEPRPEPANRSVSAAGPMALAREWYARFSRDECLTRSQALAFIAMLSLVPVLLFGLAILGFLIHDPQRAADYVRTVITHQLPGQTAATANTVIEQTHLADSARTLVERKWWSVMLGIVLLLPSAIGLFVSATEPMNAAWEVKETRGFLKLRLVCLATMFAAGLLFLLSLVASSGAFHPADLPSWANALLAVVYELIALGLNTAMFIVIYRFLPNAPVTWRSAVVGGLTAGVLWEIAKKLFEWYVAHFGSFDKVYGALGGLAGLVTWVWYSCVVLLGCAIVCKMVDEHQSGGVRASASATKV